MRALERSVEGGTARRYETMGIRFHCSACARKLNVKAFLGGRRGLCPYCGASIQIPTESTAPAARGSKGQRRAASAKAEAGGEAAEASSPRVSVQAGAPGKAPTETPTPSAKQTHAAPSGPPDRGPTSAQSPAGSGPPQEAAPIFPQAPQEAAPAAAARTQPPPGPSEPGDPLGEAPEAVWYVRPPSGGQFGPASGDVMRTWIGEGRVSPDALVWREGWRDWQAASRAFPQLGPGRGDFNFVSVASANSPSGTSGTDTRRELSRRQSSKSYGVIIGVLVAAMIGLFAALIWVLTRGGT